MKQINTEDYQIKWREGERGHLDAQSTLPLSLQTLTYCHKDSTKGFIWKARRNTMKYTPARVPGCCKEQGSKAAPSLGVKYHLPGCSSETQVFINHQMAGRIWGHWPAKTFRALIFPGCLFPLILYPALESCATQHLQVLTCKSLLQACCVRNN